MIVNEEYTGVKISMPLIDDIELQRIDTFYNDIVNEYTKAFVKEKEQVIIQRCMMNLQQENQQLKEELKDENNYHKEADKWYKEAFDLLKQNQILQKKLDKAIELLIASEYKQFLINEKGKGTIKECWLKYIEQELENNHCDKRRYNGANQDSKGISH